MEVTDVNQLMSLIEAGTVSIICDSTPLEESSEDIDNTALASDEANDTASILNQGLGGSLAIKEDDETEGTDCINTPCSVQDGVGPDESKSLDEGVKERRLDRYHSKCSQDKSSPQLDLTPEQYFLQMSDGQFIQVLGTLEQDAQGNSLPEVPLEERNSEMVPVHMEGIRDGVQILVVGDNRGDNLYLISTPDKDIEDDELRSSVKTEMSSTTLLEDTEETIMLQTSNTVMPTLPIGEEEDHVSLSDDENCQETLLQDSVHNVNVKHDSQPESRAHLSKRADKATHLTPEFSSCNKNLSLDILPLLKNQNQKTPADRDILPLKISSNYLKEGTVVKTDRGDMVAYNLSSLPQLKRSNGQLSKLHLIASTFGPAMKVLRPVVPKNEASPKTTSDEFCVFNCNDCSAVLHSERSLQNHQRKYHKDWEEECFICGKKFLNVHYVRSHIQEVHSSEKSFLCLLCSYKCESVKDLLRHHKTHKESRVCHYCGRKYITLKLYKKHVLNCRKRRKPQSNRSNSDLSPVSKDLLVEEEEHHKASNSNVDVDCLKRKNKECDSFMNDDICSSYTSNFRRKLSKTSIDQKLVKNDAEFKFESKHYHKQAKKLAQEQSYQAPQRPSRAGRERSHRCYLCFKLFSTAASLESHKENYHLSKSERPVRVKTDAALDIELNSDVKEEIMPDHNPSEEVVIKEEPVELSEDFENITIIVDESLNSPHVIKPFCIACKAHTSVDFRKHSKWFSQIPYDCQSDILKKFQQFFPCNFDPSSLVEPWLLCKKCVIIIDKIVDMEEKISSMKNHLLSRVRGNNGTHENIKLNTSSPETVIDENTQAESPLSLTQGSIKGIGRNLSEIEAYMKDKCEIMEITKPQKRRGRPKKHIKEKLTPVLVEAKCGEELVSDIAKFISHDLVKKENIKENLIETNKADKKNEEKSDITFDNVEVKQEPVQLENDTVPADSESVSWKIMSFAKKKYYLYDICTDHSNSHSNSPEMIQRNLEVTKETDSLNEELELKKNQSSGLADPKPQRFYRTFSPKHLSSTKSQDLIAVNDDRCDILETLDSENSHESNDVIHDGQDSNNCVTHESSASSDNQCGRLPSTLHLSKDQQTDSSKSNVSTTKIQGTKRAKLQEERSKMCYKVDEESPKPWRCRECNKSFSTKRGACDHYASSHKGENYACEHCSASYVRKRDLIGHYNKMHLNIKPYKCKSSECPERFSSHADLYRHLQSAHSTKKGNTKYECQICSATFAEKRYRDAHLTVCLSKSSDSVPHKCPMCSKAFKLARYLQLHMRTVHWLKSEHFFCEICNKVLTDKKNVIIHMKSHMGETKTKCEVCGKEFNRKSYLWTHMRTHTNQRPYKCNFCSKAFNQYSTWKNHERTHTGEKPYKCYMCSANFATSSSLSKHIQYGHYNIRDYECDICKKKFISKAKVEEHIKVHTGEKPFKCHICNRAFNKKNNLRNHMYVHSANKKYKCEICGEGFMRKSTIENHILECHKLEFVLNSNSEDKNVDMEVSISQFISVKGIDDVPPEDSYIIVFANEDEDLSDTKEMQVTALAEDSTSQIGVMEAPVGTKSDSSEAVTSVDSNTDVLSEGILEDPSGRNSNALTTLIANEISPSIAIAEGSSATVNQVMEIDDTSFRLVTAGDTTVPMYSE